MNARLLLALPIAFLLAGCGAARKTANQSTVIELPDIEVTDKKGPKPYQPTPPRYWDILHTNLAVRFDIPARKIMGTAVLTAKPYAYAQDSLFLDAKTMDFSSVKAQLRGQPFSCRALKRVNGYTLVFDKPLLPADTLFITVSYTSEPYRVAAAGGKAIVEERGLYFVNAEGKVPGKPLQIWTQGETESNSHWFPTIDKPGEKFTMELAIQVPDSLITISNGVLFKSEKVAGGQRTDHWKMEQPVQAYAYMMTIGNFAKIEDRPFRGKPVIYYVEPQYAPYAKAIFSNTPKMVQFFSDYTGVEYPWPKYSQVAVRDYVSGAMENTSSSLFGEFVNGNARERKDNSVEGVVAHELYHQWFGDYVTAESWNNLTLNESFATDGEILWLNYHNGKRAADAQRYNYLQRYLNSTGGNNDAPLVRNYWNAPDELFDRISYQKGGQILYYIRQLAGEELFQKALKIYLTKHAYGTAEAADWRMALEEATGTDWTAFFDQWYYKGGHPKVAFYYSYDDARRQVQVVARQPADSVYNLPIRVGVYNNDPLVDFPNEGRVLPGNDNTDRHTKWTLASKSDTLTIPYAGLTRPLIIPDVEHVIVGKVTEQKSDTMWITQMVLAMDHISQRRASIALSDAKFSTGLAAARLQLLKTDDESLQQLTYAILAPEKGSDWHRYPGITEQAETHFRDENTPPNVRAAAIRMWYKWSTKEAVLAAMPALLADSSYAVAGTALDALVAVDSAAGRKAALGVLQQGEARGYLLQTALETVAKGGNAQDLDLLTKGSESVWGAGKSPYLAALTAFFMNTKDGAATRSTTAKMVQWYGEEEATFVRRRQLNSWEELVEDVQGYSPADREIILVRRQALLQSLAGLAASETDPELVKTLSGMQKRIQESAKSDTRK